MVEGIRAGWLGACMFEPMTEPKRHRIVITGPSNSGKTTLSLRMEERWAFQATHLDHHANRSHWEGKKVHIAAIEQLTARDWWVIEGGHWYASDLLFARATVIVILDPSLLRTFPRVLRHMGWRRSIRRLWLPPLGSPSSYVWYAYYPLVERRRLFRAAHAEGVAATIIVAKSVPEAERKLAVLLGTGAVNPST